MQGEARDHVRAARPAVVPDDLCVVPGEKGVEGLAAGRQPRRAHPAVTAGGRRVPGGHLQTGERLGEPGVGLGYGVGRGRGGENRSHGETTESRS